MKVSWDDYSQHMESHKIHVPNQQPARKRMKQIAIDDSQAEFSGKSEDFRLNYAHLSD